MTNQQTFKQLANAFLVAQSKRDLLQSQLSAGEDKEKTLNKHLTLLQKTGVIVQEVSKQTQSKLEYHITNLGNMALSTVFPDPPNFKAEFQNRRNQTECDLTLDDQVPIDSMGGGPLDILSFALRVSFWALKKNRPVMILDEPFKFLSSDLQEKASDMVKTVSESLGIQIIMISHQEGINKAADRTFTVKQVNGVSEITEQ